MADWHGAGGRHMERWVVFAVASMIFAGFTSVIAKHGLANITGELGLVVRTVFVCLFVGLFALFSVPPSAVRTVGRHNLVWLGLSGVTTAASWIFYYKALKIGEVSRIALIDKGSFLVAVVLAWTFLGERPTPNVLIGSGLILAGLLIVAHK